MLIFSAVESRPSLLMIEGGLTAIVFAASFAFPRLGSSLFMWIEGIFVGLAREKRWSVAIVGLSALLLRLAMLPAFPIPDPYTTDDFGFLFAADTFAHGRITNPTPAMWTHLETLHITMKPTYASMFFPAHGLILAAGQALFGQPWYGELLVTALMCTAVCWMLQGWLPPRWALLGGLLVVLRIGLFSYWVNTYTGGGSVAALGGALVLGALPRFLRSPRLRYSTVMAIGILVLMNSRPYEGLLLCLPVAGAIVRWFLVSERRSSFALLVRCVALPLILVASVGSWMAYYNYRNFGNPLTLPYTIDRATYAVAPHFIWGAERPMPAYRFKAMHDYYVDIELPEFRRLHSFAGFLPQTGIKVLGALLFYAGFVLLPPLIMIRRLFYDRRIRMLIVSMLFLAAGMLALAGIRPYYLAPFTAAFYAIGLQAMRHLRVWRPAGRPVGLSVLRCSVALTVVLAAAELWSKPLHLSKPPSAGTFWACECLNSPQLGADREQINSLLGKLTGQHLVLVRYEPSHDAGYEWVYNSADIDNSKVIWAREMNESDNLEIIRYYKDRRIWLVQPDENPVKLTAYPIPAQFAAAASRPISYSQTNVSNITKESKP
jgi:hypothetical protein